MGDTSSYNQINMVFTCIMGLQLIFGLLFERPLKTGFTVPAFLASGTMIEYLPIYKALFKWSLSQENLTVAY